MAWLDLGTSYLNQKKLKSKVFIVSMTAGQYLYAVHCLTLPIERGKVRQAKIRKIKTNMKENEKAMTKNIKIEQVYD